VEIPTKLELPIGPPRQDSVPAVLGRRAPPPAPPLIRVIRGVGGLQKDVHPHHAALEAITRDLEVKVGRRAVGTGDGGAQPVLASVIGPERSRQARA